MGMLLILIGGLCALAGLVAGFIILIEAFKDEIWKGLLSLLCGLYGLYYALFEFDHEQKWTIVLTALFGGGVGGWFTAMGLQMLHGPR